MKKPVLILFLISVLLLSMTACRSAASAVKQAATELTEKHPMPAAEAEDIALSHAGVKREDVRFDRTDYDNDDGVPTYEIEFHADGWEYDYEIQAETGEIRSSQKEQKD